MTSETAKPENRYTRRAIISVAVIGALFLALWAALQLDPMRRLIVDSGLAAAESENFKLSYERIGGNWPWSIRIQNIDVSDKEGVWLSAADVTLNWSPFALVRGNVTASHLKLDQIHIARTPVSDTTEPSDPHILPPLPTLPVSINVSRFEATNVTVDKAVLGAPVAANLNGKLFWQGDTIRLLAQLSEDRDRSLRANLKSKIDARRNVLELDLDLKDGGTGLLNHLSGLGEGQGITVSASGNGPETDWRGQFAVETDSAGKVSGTINVSDVRPLVIETDIRAYPGPDTPDEIAQLLGKQATLKLSGRNITVESIVVDQLAIETDSGIAGTATGTANWQSGSMAGDAAFSIGDLSTLSALANSDMSGTLSVNAKASGALNAPDVTATLRGQTIRIDDTPFGTVLGNIFWPGRGTQQGSLELSIDSPLGPGSFVSSVSRTKGNEIRLAGLSGDWLSSQFKGDITLHPNANPSGSLTFNIASLEQISFLSQFAGFSSIGGSAQGAVHLPRPDDPGTQKIDANFANFRFGNGTEMIAADTLTLIGAVGTGADQRVSASLVGNGILLPGVFSATTLARAEVTIDGRLTDAQWRMTADEINRTSDRLSARGTFQTEDKGPQKIVLSGLTGQLAGETITLKSPTTFTQTETGWDLSKLDLAYGDGTIVGTAKSLNQGLSADLDVSRLPLTIETEAFDPIEGRFNARVQLDTISTQKTGSADFSLASTSGDTPLAPTRATATWDGEELRITGDLEEVGRFDGSLPLTFSNGAFGIAPNGTIGFSANLSGRLGPLWQLGPFSEYDLAGDASLDMTASGTWGKPVISGHGRLANGRFESFADGILFENVSVDLSAQNSERAALSMTATDGDGGRIKGDGTIRLEADNNVPLSITAEFDKAKILRSENYDAQISGQVKLAGKTDALSLTGDVLINRMDIRIPNDLPPSVVDIPVELVNVPPALRDTAQSLDQATETPIALDLNLRAPNRIFVEGRGLNSEWKAKARIFGDTNTPRIDGLAEVVKGTFDFAGRPFDLEQGQVVFDGGKSIDPRLDVLASREDDDITVSVEVTGLASDPDFSFQSNPSLPQEDVLARILFGKPLENLTYVELAQLGESVASLSGKGLGGGGRGFFGNVRQSLGVDVLSVDTGSIASAAADDEEVVGPSLTVGKYVSDRVYVGITQGTDEDSTAVEVEVDITRHLSLSTEVGQKANSNIGLNWSWDY